MLDLKSQYPGSVSTQTLYYNMTSNAAKHTIYVKNESINHDLFAALYEKKMKKVNARKV